METTPMGPSVIVAFLPILFTGLAIVVIVLVIRFFIRLGADVRAIRTILEEKQGE